MSTTVEPSLPDDDLEPRLWVKVVVALLVCGLLLGGAGRVYHWAAAPSSESRPEESRIEALTFDVGPEAVAGTIVRIAVHDGENVSAGQVVAELDATPYREQVERALTRLAAAAAEVKKQEAGAAQLKKEIPLRVEAAKKGVEVARAEKARAEAEVKRAVVEAAREIEEGQAALEVARLGRDRARKEADKFIALGEAASPRRAQDATSHAIAAEASWKLAQAKLKTAEAQQTRVVVAQRAADAAEKVVEQALKAAELAEAEKGRIEGAELAATAAKRTLADAKQERAGAEKALDRTKIQAPASGIVAGLVRRVGDLAAPGVPIVTLSRPNVLFVTVPLTEKQISDVAPGNRARIEVQGINEPFHGRVLEIHRLAPRPSARILIEKDEHWPKLKIGLPARVTIEPGPGDPKWAEQAAREVLALPR